MSDQSIILPDGEVYGYCHHCHQIHPRLDPHHRIQMKSSSPSATVKMPSLTESYVLRLVDKL